MQFHPFVTFNQVRAQSRNISDVSNEKTDTKGQHMNSRSTLHPLPLLIQDAPPPEDARLLDAAHTLVNLQQTTERQTRQQSGGATLNPDSQIVQNISRAINLPQSTVLRTNQIGINHPVGSAVTPVSSGIFVTSLTSIQSPSLPIIRSTIPIQMVGSTTPSLAVASLGNVMTKPGPSININAHMKESALPERTMMPPPPSSGRGGGRGGRGVKSKGAPIVAGNVGRGRGRGRGRGLPSVCSNLVTTSKASSAAGSVPAHYSGIYMDDKNEYSISSPRGMSTSPPPLAALRNITTSDYSLVEERGIDDISMSNDGSNARVVTNEGSSSSNNDKDNFSDLVNGEDQTKSNDIAESTFMVGGLKIRSGVLDDLLNERKLELFSDPEIMTLLSSIMQQSKTVDTE